jgi:hypothetical protein
METPMKFTVEFDDEVLSQVRFRFHVLRTLSVGKHRRILMERQRGECPVCHETLDLRARSGTPLAVQVDHVVSVKQFASDINRWPNLNDAYRSCHSLENLRAIHHRCNQRRNRRDHVE